MMMHAINQEIGRGSVSNPDFTPLDRANVRDFSWGLFITAVHRRGGRMPEVWLLPTDKEARLLARKTRLVSARLLRAPYIAFLAVLPFSRARGFGSIR